VRELYQPLIILQTNVDIGQGMFAQWNEACAPQKAINLKKYGLESEKMMKNRRKNKR